MTKKPLFSPSERREIVFSVAIFGLFFLIYAFYAGPQFVIGSLKLIIMLVLAVLAWKPLHKRFRAWAILYLYFFIMTFVGVGLKEDVSLSELTPALLGGLALSGFFLLIGRQKPIEQREPSVAFLVLHGCWDALAEKGVPADEIERLKRLTREERAALWASLSSGKSWRGWEKATDDHPFIDPYNPSNLSLRSPWHDD